VAGTVAAFRISLLKLTIAGNRRISSFSFSATAAEK
jgi:hypothetical protein